MKKNDSVIELLLTGGVFIVLACITTITDTTGDSGDSIMHYLYSKYAFRYPEFFLHHWAKPVFVLLSAPFAQFGFTGIEIFNCVCASLSALFAGRTARNLNIRAPWLVFIIIFFSPLWFKMIFSGLTEYLFALLLMLSIYLITGKRMAAALLLVSFLPLVRSEGLLILGVFGIYLMLNNKFSYLPLLLSGQALYSVAGALYYNDLLWVFHQIPYDYGSTKYGHGEIFDFFIRLKKVIEIPIAILLVVGCGRFLWSAFRFGFKKIGSIEICLLLGSVAVVFVAHSIFWWLGIFSSFGMARVLIPLVPIIAIIALKGLVVISDYFTHPIAQKLVMIIIICVVVLYPFTTYREKSVIFNDRLFTVLDNQLVEDEILPYFYDEMIMEQEVLYYYSHQNLSFFMEIDHFDPCFHRPLKDLRDSDIPDGSVIIWDNWFSVVEEGIRLEDLKNDPRFELVRIFTSKDKFRIVEYVVFRAIA